MEYEKYLNEISAKRKTMVSTGDRSAKIRTYNYPQSRVTDHRINYTMHNLPVFMDGEIQEVIDLLQIAENTERLRHDKHLTGRFKAEELPVLSDWMYHPVPELNKGLKRRLVFSSFQAQYCLL